MNKANEALTETISKMVYGKTIDMEKLKTIIAALQVKGGNENV